MKTPILSFLLCLFAICGMTQTVTDSFNGSQVNAAKWQAIAAFGDTTITESNGNLRLRNGAKILTQASFGSPMEINGKFRFSGNVHDNFIFVFRTTSATYPNDSIELTNGIAIRIEPENDTSSSFCTFLAQRMNDSHQFGITNRTFVMNQFYNFRLTDDGTNFSFYFDDMTTPLLSGSDTLTLGQRVGFYNRPGNGGGSSISDGSQVDIDWLDISSPIRSHAQPPFNLDLVAYYPFNGNANDASGNGHNGAPNGVVSAEDRFGQSGEAYSFGGDGDHVSIQPAPNFWSSGEFTFSCWIKIQPGGLSQPRILCNGTLDVGLTDTSGNPQVFFAGWGFYGLVYTNKLRSGIDYHLAGSYDGTSVRLYLDGSQVAFTNVTWTFQITSLPFGIGRNLDTGTDWFSGIIDDVRLYSRALSSNEVAELYALESPEKISIKKAVYLDSSSLRVGTNYQLQVSSDLNTWTNHGGVFTATNSSWRTTNYWDVDNWDSFFFRLQRIP